jgi:hypothetical protein
MRPRPAKRTDSATETRTSAGTIDSTTQPEVTSALRIRPQYRENLSGKTTSQENLRRLTPSFATIDTSYRLASRRSVGIDAALDLCHALLMADDHRRDRDCAAYEDGADRNQQTAQARD